MDYTNIPSCALLRHGTVIVRLKMEVTCSCGEHKVCPVTDCPEAVHRIPKCEQCSRTRINSKYSDCDSGLVDKSRPYRSSAARSRYVNVCAAVCLLLLASELSPQSSAAPPRTHTMHRQRRSTEENQTWGNPCDLDLSVIPAPVKYEPKLAQAVARQALNAFNNADSYKEEFARELHDMDFTQALTQWESYVWMHEWSLNRRPWFREGAMPSHKKYGTNLDEKFLNDLMKNVDDHLPPIYKSMKVVVASLMKVSAELPQTSNPAKKADLENKLADTSSRVRSVLCEFEALMKSRHLEIYPLWDSEVPEYPLDRRLQDSLLVYRDTLNYLEYVIQFFDKMAKTVST